MVDAVLSASRALVAVAARSLHHAAEDVTLVQYRVLVELAARGPQRLADLAAVLDVDASTATRMCERLVRKGLVAWRRSATDRRLVRVSLAAAGPWLVADVTARRSRRSWHACPIRTAVPSCPLYARSLQPPGRFRAKVAPSWPLERGLRPTDFSTGTRGL